MSERGLSRHLSKKQKKLFVNDSVTRRTRLALPPRAKCHVSSSSAIQNGSRHCSVSQPIVAGKSMVVRHFYGDEMATELSKVHVVRTVLLIWSRLCRRRRTCRQEIQQ